jgi:hypothetical protein
VSRVPQVVLDPQDPKGIVEHLYRVQRVVDQRIEFGSPQDPRDPTSTVRALGGVHNGTLQNVEGSWFEAVLSATGRTTLTCVHNLDVATNQPATAPNVRWLVFGVQHNGTGADGTTTYAVDVWYQGGTRTADAIDLGFNLVVGGTVPTVNAGNPVVVTLFFTRAVR